MSCYTLFNRQDILLLPLSHRGSDLHWSDCLSLDSPHPLMLSTDLRRLSGMILDARRGGYPVILLLGGHPIKLGLSRFLIDLVDADSSLTSPPTAPASSTTSSWPSSAAPPRDVPRWLSAGQFGLWRETSRLNDIIAQAAREGEGLGEAVGRVIEEERFPHRDLSLAAACWRTGVPLTCHVTVGADIIHAHPNCDGAALGQASYTDFLIFARAIQDLEGGVLPQRRQRRDRPGGVPQGPVDGPQRRPPEGRAASATSPRRSSTSPPCPRTGARARRARTTRFYYNRGFKTVLVRAVADGGQSFYVRGDHRADHPRPLGSPRQPRGPGRIAPAAQQTQTFPTTRETTHAVDNPTGPGPP